MAKVLIATLLDSFDLVPQFQNLTIIETQLGAVGRPTQPALAMYKKIF
jgi:hypothetical protein